MSVTVELFEKAELMFFRLAIDSTCEWLSIHHGFVFGISQLGMNQLDFSLGKEINQHC